MMLFDLNVTTYKYDMRRILLFLLIGCIGCQKERRTCRSSTPVTASFSIQEEVGDSLFICDTTFAGRFLHFKTSKLYDSIHWKLDNNNQSTSADYKLYFPTSTGMLDVTLEVFKKPNTECFPNDDGKDVGVKNFVILPNNGSIVSPIVGTYLGYVQGKEKDTFSVSIKFWKGDRYPFWKDGAYSIHNLPKGYNDSTKEINGFKRPELNGIQTTTGYKAIYFNEAGSRPAQGVHGYAYQSLSNRDSLYIIYKVYDTLKFSQSGKYEEHYEKFMGIRKN